MDDRLKLPSSYSLYLDILRFAAAAAVYLNHIAKYPFVPEVARGTPLSPLELYGAPAVTVFFVLSGYVIAYVVATRERDVRTYAISRVSRLYSVVIPALALTLLLDTIGSTLDPGLYAHRVVSPEPMDATGFVASFFLVNEFQLFGFEGTGPGSNGPWWSLSFEAAYYLLAGLALFAPRKLAVVACLVVLAIVGRTIVALAPLWLLGFCLFRYREPLRRLLPAPTLLWALSLGAIAVIPHLLGNSPDMNFGLHFPWARAELNRNLALDYAVAAAFSVHLLCVDRYFSGRPAPGRVERSLQRHTALIRFLGAMTFPLYAMHRPAMFFFASISPWPPTSTGQIAFVTSATLLLAVGATPLCDALKLLMRDRIGRIWRVNASPAKS